MTMIIISNRWLKYFQIPFQLFLSFLSLTLALASILDASTVGSLTFAIPLAKVHEQRALFAAIESGAIPGIRDWGLSHTSMSTHGCVMDYIS